MKLPPGYQAGVGVHKATAFGGVGQKLLEKLGWREGQGLGKEKNGRAEALEVKKKEDTRGVSVWPMRMLLRASAQRWVA
jgi:hypothetical protein